MAESLKKQALKGVAWSGLEKFSIYFVTFIVNIVMARLLTPADYGVVGIIAVFMSFAQLFIDGGFTTALISKGNKTTDNDFNTVFVFNLSASLIIYIVLFLFAPFIESFYGIEGLGNIVKIYCLILIISSFSAIQITKFNINIDFKTTSLIAVPSAIISGIMGVIMAYLGCGVWSIVGQHLIMAVLRLVLTLYYARWTPKFKFCYKTFRNLFAFSSNLMLSSIIDKIYTNSYPLFIGKFFSPATLGNYTRGDQFGRLPSGLLEDLFNRVTLPMMSKVQDDDAYLILVYRKYVQISSFIIFPIMMIVVVLAEPLIKIILTEKWLGCVIFMQIMSMATMMNHIGTINRNLLYVKRHSDYALKLELFKKFVALAIFFVSIYWGIWGICIGQLIYGFLAPTLNSLYTKRLIGLNLFQQILDYGGILLLSIVSAIMPLWFLSNIPNAWQQILVGLFSYVMIYILANMLFHTTALKYVTEETNRLFHNIRK